MNTPPDRCQRCGYRVAACPCAQPLTPVHATVSLDGYPDPMPPGDVAQVFSVDPKSVNRWAKTGRLASFATPGGHRRYRKVDVQALLNGQGGE